MMHRRSNELVPEDDLVTRARLRARRGLDRLAIRNAGATWPSPLERGSSSRARPDELALLSSALDAIVGGGVA